MIFRCIAPAWLLQENPSARRVHEGEFDDARIKELNAQGYNIYFLPNYPSRYEGGHVTGAEIDTFRFVFCDMDLKDNVYLGKDAFLSAVKECGLPPTHIVDSGNGVHAYWHVTDLDAMNFLRIQRRLIKMFNTDEAVGQIYQLMRAPGTLNTKVKGDYKPCELMFEADNMYTCEQLDALLPPLTHEDEQYCQVHFKKTYELPDAIKIQDKIPEKFTALLRANREVKDIWAGNTPDRSVSDFRLGHIMQAHGFTKQEALSVLVNSGKAMARAPIHRLSYAQNIVEKIEQWEKEEDKTVLNLSSSVKDILSRGESAIKGERFPCSELIDKTHHGFRLGQVIGLVAGSGVGKTAMALNMFRWFVQNNPNYDHFFIPLEQPANEIADRWRSMCGKDTQLHDKVQVISNYDEKNGYRNLSFDDIRKYLIKYKEVTGRKIGCVVIDHIGALRQENKDGRSSIETICHQMKAFAIETNTLLVMQSQTSREKAGIGDLEIDKDAAYGTMYFEAYTDYLITIWQPLKRCYDDPMCPPVTAFKFCKIRHKKKDKDNIQEDVRYRLFFDTETEIMRDLTQNEKESFEHFNKMAFKRRNADRKVEIAPYKSMDWMKNGKTDSNQDSAGTAKA